MPEISNPWKVIKEKLVYDNPWINVTEYDVVNPSGNNGIYGKVHFKNTAIGIVALDADQNIYLVGQYRFVLNCYSWELPEGGCPLGETYIDAAKRELLEETGLIASNWKQILHAHLSNSVCDEYCVIFLATGLQQSVAAPEDTEDITVKKIPFSEVVKLVNNGSITDSVSIMAIQKIQLMLLQHQL